ncbi:MAG TPA: glycosyl hydrolase family 18 protein [Candidatus Limnocylindrales bacterium]|nr:glycosyl hydrolase family 18 protein [Candidatus Limnocylindrales bacterium]
MTFGFHGRLRHAIRAGATLVAVLMAGQGGLGPSAAGLGGAGVPTVDRTVDVAPRAQVAAESRPLGLETSRSDDPAAPPATPVDAGGGLPSSVQFEEAQAHQNDRIAFTPGTRVSIGFTPGRDDRWPVGGAEPAALPAGRLDGASIRAQGRPEGATSSSLLAEPAPAPPVADPTVDGPSGARSQGIAAVSTSWLPSEASTTADPAVEPDAPIRAAGLRREIFGFLPYWQLNSSSLRIDYSKISTIAYFGVGADAAGNLMKKNPDGSSTVGWGGWTSARMTGIISAAHATHTRVVLTVQSFGWNAAGLARQKALLGSPVSRLRLARQIAAAVRDRGADGVNLDFEPLAPRYDTQFTALVRSIRTELHRIHRGYQLTFDTTGSIGNYPIEKATAPGGADAIFVMAYDYRTSSSSPVGSVAPLDRTGYGIADTIAAYLARVPASKLILGVPYYGRAWSTPTNLLNASNRSGARFGDSTTVGYATAAEYLAKFGRRYDPVEQVAWTAYPRTNCTARYGCVTTWRQIYVDDAAAVKAKYDLVNRYGLRGAGIWALGYDGTRPELWQAIQQKFMRDTTPPTIGVRATLGRFSPNGDGDADTTRLVWSSSEAISGTARILRGTTVVRSWRIRGAAAGSVSWSGTDAAGRRVPDGTYTFRVDGRDGGRNAGSGATSIVLDRTLSSLRLTPGLFFPQDGDRLGSTATATFRLARSASVSIAIYQGPTLVRTAVANRLMPAGTRSWTWDGRNAAGSFVAPGRYTIQVAARTSLGTSVLTRTVLADAFFVALSATTLRKGQTLTVTVTSAEPLRSPPAVLFGQRGRATVAKTAVALGGGRYRVAFTVASSAGPAVLRIVGRDRSGGTNATSVSLVVR